MHEFAESLEPTESEEKSVTGWIFEASIFRSRSRMLQVYQILVRSAPSDPVPEAHRSFPLSSAGAARISPEKLGRCNLRRHYRAIELFGKLVIR